MYLTTSNSSASSGQINSGIKIWLANIPDPRLYACAGTHASLVERVHSSFDSVGIHLRVPVFSGTRTRSLFGARVPIHQRSPRVLTYPCTHVIYICYYGRGLVSRSTRSSRSTAFRCFNCPVESGGKRPPGLGISSDNERRAYSFYLALFSPSLFPISDNCPFWK